MAATHSLQLVTASSQYATINDASSPNIDITGSQTWECWHQVAAIGTQYYMAGIRASGGGSSKGFWIASNNTIHFVLSGLTTNSDVFYTPTRTANTWVHVAGVYNSGDSTLKLYINGELVSSLSASGTSAAITAGFSIGRLGDQAASYFGGKVRNFRIWNVARTQAQIRADMNVETPSDTTGLQGNWILNNTYTDSSANGYDLTASGSPTFSTTYPDALDLTENSNWTKKHKITIDADQVSGSADLTDVPIVLTESNFLADAFSNSLNGGVDLRFSTDADGKNRLAHEIVNWDVANSTGEVWLKINTLSYNTDTDIYVHYGNSNASALDENEAFGKHQVWGANWDMMYHLQGNATDSTNVSNDGTASNVSYATANGKLGQGGSFNGSSSYIDLASYPISGSQSFTFGVWFKTSSIGTDKTIIAVGNMTSSLQGFIVYVRSTNKFGWDLSISGGTNSTTTVTDGNWHFGVIVNNAGTFQLYLDGATEGGTSSKSPNITTGTKRIGHYSAYYNGSLDNPFFYAGALSADFITTLYNNQNSPSTFAIPSAINNGNFFYLLA